jgi:hypothetical protein
MELPKAERPNSSDWLEQYPQTVTKCQASTGVAHFIGPM